MQEQFTKGTQPGVSPKVSRPSTKTVCASTAFGLLMAGIVCAPVLGFAAERSKSEQVPANNATAPSAAPVGTTPSGSAATGTTTSTPSTATPATASEPSKPADTTATASQSAQPTFTTVGDYDIQIEKRTEPIPFHTYMRMSKDVAPGHVKESSKGENGILEKQFKVYYKKGNAEKSELLSSKVVKEPVDQVTYCGIRVRDARALPSRSGSYDRVRELNMVATGYAPWQGSSRGLCATGARAGYGVVAVDPRVIPMHSKLYIEGYGYAIAEDTGGAIKRNRIDLGHNTYREAESVGRRKVHVYVLSDR